MRIISDKTLSGHGRVPDVRKYRIVGLMTSAVYPSGSNPHSYAYSSRYFGSISRQVTQLWW